MIWIDWWSEYFIVACTMCVAFLLMKSYKINFEVTQKQDQAGAHRGLWGEDLVISLDSPMTNVIHLVSSNLQQFKWAMFNNFTLFFNGFFKQNVHAKSIMYSCRFLNKTFQEKVINPLFPRPLNVRWSCWKVFNFKIVFRNKETFILKFHTNAKFYRKFVTLHVWDSILWEKGKNIFHLLNIFVQCDRRQFPPFKHSWVPGPISAKTLWGSPPGLWVGEPD